MQAVVAAPEEPYCLVGLNWLSEPEGAKLLELLPLLPIQAQTTLQLFYVEDLTASEVAFVLDVDVAEVLKCHDDAVSFFRASLQ